MLQNAGENNRASRRQCVHGGGAITKCGFDMLKFRKCGQGFCAVNAPGGMILSGAKILAFNVTIATAEIFL